jgi:hypothetical protein
MIYAEQYTVADLMDALRDCEPGMPVCLQLGRGRPAHPVKSLVAPVFLKPDQRVVLLRAVNQ